MKNNSSLLTAETFKIIDDVIASHAARLDLEDTIESGPVQNSSFFDRLLFIASIATIVLFIILMLNSVRPIDASIVTIDNCETDVECELVADHGI